MTSPLLLASVTRSLLSRLFSERERARARHATRHAVRADAREPTVRRPGSSRTRPFFCPCWRKRLIGPLDKLGDAGGRDLATGLGFFPPLTAAFAILRHCVMLHCRVLQRLLICLSSLFGDLDSTALLLLLLIYFLIIFFFS